MPPREILWNNERPRALRPQVQRLPHLMRLPLNAGRANVKKRYKRLSFAQAPQKGCGTGRGLAAP